MSLKAVTREGEAWALFLDVDGTLLEIAETPQGVVVPEVLKFLLNRLSLHLDGALALISGRSLADLDALLTPMRFCASGVHGCERRESNGCVIRPAGAAKQLDRARSELAELVHDNPGLLLEDKGCGLALHYRRVPHLGERVRDIMAALCVGLGSEFVLQGGKCVYEIRPADSGKGGAVAAFMGEVPFRGRRPVYVGDDTADEDAFEVTNRLDGISVRVGAATSTSAGYRLACVGEVIDWLRQIPLVVPPATAIQLEQERENQHR